jgi:hypothetical protein
MSRAARHHAIAFAGYHPDLSSGIAESDGAGRVIMPASVHRSNNAGETVPGIVFWLQANRRFGRSPHARL